jgi:recombination protein RecA
MMAKKGKAKVEKLSPLALKNAINKRWPGAMVMASDPTLVIERLPTGVLTVDALLGGGFPRNRFAEIYGSASVGKTYLVLKMIATCQKMGLRCAWVDVEKTFDPVFAAAIGVDLDELAFHTQVHGARCVDFMETLLRSGQYDVIAMDSIASLLPLAEYENDMEAGSYGMEQAKLMSKALRKLTAANSRTAMIFINQTRENVGVMFGSKTLAPGGKAMGHYAGIRLELVRTENLKRKGKVPDKKTGEIKEGDVVFGHRVLVKAAKDKTGSILRPGDETTFVFNYEKARHDHVEDLIYLGRVHGLIKTKKTGNTERWWVDGYDDESVVGRPKFKTWLRKNRAVREELEENIRKKIARA